MTVKAGHGMARHEWETEIEEWVCAALWPYVTDRTIKKTRYSLVLQGQRCELDIYHDQFNGLVILEHEAPTTDLAMAFAVPAAFVGATEVTDDERFKNKNLAKYGLPESS
ncbi:MAG: hypothetical protein HY460_01190 [Parcubacteria group bacterium]|nr:hypothetical protein [Parcubacteria group bacterium]